MITRLRRQFIRIAVGVLAGAMLLLLAAVNLVNWSYVQRDIRETMSEVISSDSRLLSLSYGTRMNRHGKMKESFFESRYFTVYVHEETLHSDLSHVASYTEEEAAALAQKALIRGEESGFLEDCYYTTVTASDGLTAYVFLNCETRLASVRSLALISVIGWAAAIAVSAVLVGVFSRRAIRPYVENMERQKRFITDASHELKTPLSVISANMDVLALDVPDNEWILSTQKNVGVMRRLVNDMVFLSRADEGSGMVNMLPFDFAQVAAETAEAFTALAEMKEQCFETELPDTLMVTGDERGLTRLVSVLCDNAVKYAPEGDTIRLRLRQDGHKVVLETENTLAEPMSAEQLKHLFDRFWRADVSRGGEKGGFGIGLAIAQSVCEQHGGEISAEAQGDRLRIVCRVKADSGKK